MFHGRPVYDPNTLELLDLGGNPLDLHQVFDLVAQMSGNDGVTLRPESLI